LTAATRDAGDVNGRAAQPSEAEANPADLIDQAVDIPYADDDRPTDS
jgi:hypothetical protein